MKNKKLLLLFGILVLVLGIVLIYNRKGNRKVYINQDGMLLSISDGNGGTLNGIPYRGLYDVDVNCVNGEGSWDYDGWSIVVKNIVGDITCDLTFKSLNRTQNFSQYIASLSGTEQGNGALVNENGYRYEGKNPNNYVWFNDELWRIIGVFGSANHGVTNDPKTINGVSDTYLVKIIRAEPLAGYAWHGASGNNKGVWQSSTLYRTLNGCYLNSLTASDTTNISGSSVACSTYCKGYYNDSSTSPNSVCNFSAVGIKTYGEISKREMIQEATWHLGAPGASNFESYYPDDIYSYELNSSAVYTGRNDTATGKVGLMNISDYAYAASSSTCTRGSYVLNANTNSGYSNSACLDNNWLFDGAAWTLDAHSANYNEVWRINAYGTLTSSGASLGAAVRPVVYLSSDVYKVDGTGTQSDPYYIMFDYVKNFDYSANVQTLTVPFEGYYIFEVYGAAGGSYNETYATGGKGGYATGMMHLDANETLYIYTGGKGTVGNSTTDITAGGGTNGGGNAGYRGGGGGGATDIRINTDSLYARVIVAGGGGGAYAYNATYKANGGDGGSPGSDGAVYSDTYVAFAGKGGTATAGGAGGTGPNASYSGVAGDFGVGGNTGRNYSTTYYSGGGGGGGWYGGGGAANYNSTSSNRNRAAGGGGGSSYIYTVETQSQYPAGCLLNGTNPYQYTMSSDSMTSGVNDGNGYAIITYCGHTSGLC